SSDVCSSDLGIGEEIAAGDDDGDCGGIAGGGSVDGNLDDLAVWGGAGRLVRFAHGPECLLGPDEVAVRVSRVVGSEWEGLSTGIDAVDALVALLDEDEALTVEQRPGTAAILVHS